MTIAEIVEREVTKAYGFNCGMESCHTHQSARAACHAVAKAVREEDADIILRVGNEKWNKFAGDTQWGAAQQAAVTETVNAIGNAVLAAEGPRDPGKVGR